MKYDLFFFALLLSSSSCFRTGIDVSPPIALASPNNQNCLDQKQAILKLKNIDLDSSVDEIVTELGVNASCKFDQK